jgi:hypothetical protein
MRRGQPLALSLVERGWRAARECSLALCGDGVATLHLVKGRIGPEVFRLVERPPGMRMAGIPYAWFWPAAYLVCQWLRASGRLHGVLVDNDRSCRRVSRWLRPGAGRVIVVQEAGDGWRCSRDGTQFPAASWREAFGEP